MMNMCQFGVNLTICKENRVLTSFFIELNDPGDLENKVNKI